MVTMKKICRLFIFMVLLAVMTTTAFAEEAEETEAEAPVETVAVVEPVVPAVATASAADLGQQYIKEAFDAMDGVKTGSFQVTLDGVSSGMKLTGIMAFKGEVKPEMAVEGTMTTVMTSILNRETRHEQAFYSVQEGKDLVTYMQNDKGIWEKSITKDFTAMMKSSVAKSSQENLSEFMATVSKVQLLKDDETGRQVQVSIDMQKLSASAVKQMETAKVKKEDRENVQKYLAAMGNVEAVLTIDPSTKYVTAVMSDLTLPCRHIASMILAESKSVTPVQKELAQRIIDSSTLNLSVTESDFNAVPAAVVPAEIKEKAVIVKPEDKAKDAAASVKA